MRKKIVNRYDVKVKDFDALESCVNRVNSLITARVGRILTQQEGVDFQITSSEIANEYKEVTEKTVSIANISKAMFELQQLEMISYNEEKPKNPYFDVDGLSEEERERAEQLQTELFELQQKARSEKKSDE